MSDMFEYLEAQAQEDNIPFKNSAAVAIDRAERRFGSFIAGAKGDKEFNARVALVEEDLLKIATEVCDEHGFDDPQHIARLMLGQLEVLADRSTDSKDTASVGNIERQTLKSQDPSGYYTEPTIALNPNSAGDHMKNTNPSIPELKPDDHQHPSEKEWPWNSDIPHTGDGLTQVDIDKPMQPEFNVGDSTMTFPNKGQADPVTSSKKKSEILDFDMEEWEEFPSSMEDPSLEHAQDFGEFNEAKQMAVNLLADNNSVVSVRNALVEQYGQKMVDRWGFSIPALREMRGDARGNRTLDTMYGLNGGMGGGMMGFAASVREAAERMDFNTISEAMTPAEAVDHLVDSGMEHHEASDRIYWYVNHVNPGWANKSWTAAVEETEYDVLGPDELTPRDHAVLQEAQNKLKIMNQRKLPAEQVKLVGINRITREPQYIFPDQPKPVTEPSSAEPKPYLETIKNVTSPDPEAIMLTKEERNKILTETAREDAATTREQRKLERQMKEEAESTPIDPSKVRRFVFDEEGKGAKQVPLDEESLSYFDIRNKRIKTDNKTKNKTKKRKPRKR